MNVFLCRAHVLIPRLRNKTSGKLQFAFLCFCAGILWNLSSKDNLKEKLAKEALPELTDKILIPLSKKPESDGIPLTPSEADIFNNTTGCLRYASLVCLLSSAVAGSFILMYIFWFSWACLSSHDHINICRTCFGRTLQLTCQLTATGALFFNHTLHF